MSEVVVCQASHVGVELIAPYLRVDDVRELEAAGVKNIRADLHDSIDRPLESFIAYVNDLPVAIFGLTDFEEVYAPWMVGTNYLDDHPLQCLRVAKKFVSRWSQVGPLVNVVHGKHVTSRRWLGVLGFDVEEVPSQFVQGEPFHIFTKEFAPCVTR